ncbi:hypothetical protein [Streptomyces sp. NPDC051554]|uniref:hypothetical protein n=1 Tax=Streptomyces sp. NPDC051554 TaxID=3365656 RepID=UPI0037909B90
MTSSSAFLALARYGWDDAWADEFAHHDAEGLLAGRVVRVDRGQCDVVTADGTLRADTTFVTPNDPLRVVCTGDWVAVEPAGNPRYVRTYLPRRTAFVRSTSSKRSEGQILAANVDHAIVAVPLTGDLDLGRIERFLALAWESGATVQRLLAHRAYTSWSVRPTDRDCKAEVACKFVITDRRSHDKAHRRGVRICSGHFNDECRRDCRMWKITSYLVPPSPCPSEKIGCGVAQNTCSDPYQDQLYPRLVLDSEQVQFSVAHVPSSVHLAIAQLRGISCLHVAYLYGVPVAEEAREEL